MRNRRILHTYFTGSASTGSGCLCPEYTLLTAILRHLRLLKDEVILLDTPAGLEHFGRAVADGFTCAVVVADHSYNALSVARESAALARQLGIGHIILVVNRVGRPEDRDKARNRAGRIDEFSRIILLSFTSEVIAAEPEVFPLLATESDFMRAIKSLAETIHYPQVRSPFIGIPVRETGLHIRPPSAAQFFRARVNENTVIPGNFSFSRIVHLHH